MGLLTIYFLAEFLCSTPALAQAPKKEAHQEIIFKKRKVQIGENKILVEIAETPQQQKRGLMFRQTLKPDEGMLFVFPDESTRSFWMKNTYIDLSIGFFDKNKKLVDVQEMKATSMMQEQPPSYVSAAPAMYALEMNKGWFKQKKIKLGQVFRFAD